MNEALVVLFRHKTWATLLLIQACQALDQEMLEATTPGTYGTIQDTLRRLVAADESYLATVTAVPAAQPLLSGQVSLERLADDQAPWSALGDPGARSRQRPPQSDHQ
jgi:uncharacterized damage-inducible protein DinB